MWPWLDYIRDISGDGIGVVAKMHWSEEHGRYFAHVPDFPAGNYEWNIVRDLDWGAGYLGVTNGVVTEDGDDVPLAVPDAGMTLTFIYIPGPVTLIVPSLLV